MNIFLEAAYEIAGVPVQETARHIRTKLLLHAFAGRPSLTAATPPMGYAAAAAELNVSTSLLWRVLNKKVTSGPLLSRYNKLLEGGAS